MGVLTGTGWGCADGRARTWPGCAIQKLYSYPGNYRTFKALIAAKYAGVEIELPPFQFGVENHAPAWKALCPKSMVPALVTKDGHGLQESNAIARYVALQTADGQKLLGSTAYEQALVAAFVDTITADFGSVAVQWLYPILGFSAFVPEETERGKANAQKALSTFNTILADRTYLVGEHVTLADIVFACQVLNLFKLVCPSFGQESATGE